MYDHLFDTIKHTKSPQMRKKASLGGEQPRRRQGLRSKNERVVIHTTFYTNTTTLFVSISLHHIIYYILYFSLFTLFLSLSCIFCCIGCYTKNISQKQITRSKFLTKNMQNKVHKLFQAQIPKVSNLKHLKSSEQNLESKR